LYSSRDECSVRNLPRVLWRCARQRQVAQPLTSMNIISENCSRCLDSIENSAATRHYLRTLNGSKKCKSAQRSCRLGRKHSAFGYAQNQFSIAWEWCCPTGLNCGPLPYQGSYPYLKSLRYLARSGQVRSFSATRNLWPNPAICREASLLPQCRANHARFPLVTAGGSAARPASSLTTTCSYRSADLRSFRVPVPTRPRVLRPPKRRIHVA
jgi:hypothetical protein